MSDPETRATLFLLGRPRLVVDGRDAPLPSGKALGLLAYVSLAGGATRAKLAGLLWSDLGEDGARTYLRQMFYRLKPAPIGAFLRAGDPDVTLAPDLATDVARFRAHAAAGRFGEALDAYGGPFLDGAEVPGAEDFEEWRHAEREALARERLAAIARHAGALEERGEWRSALDWHLAALRDDELQEAHHRAAMRLHARLGEREAALARFERLRALLNDELGLDPLPETALLAERIRTQTDLPTAAPGDAPTAPFALPDAPLVGRDGARAWLAARTGAALVVGDPGVGKTRLAAEAARGPAVVLRGHELSVSTPFAPLEEALRAHRAALAGLEDVWRVEVARLVPDVAPDRAADPPTPEGRGRFLEGLARALTLAVGDGTLVLDDLHWFDSATLEVAALVERRARPRVIATARGPELAENGAAEGWLAALDREGRLARLPLEPLGEAGVFALVERLSRRPAALFSRRLFGATGGNPLFVLETLRELHAAGLLRVDDDGWSTPFDEATNDYAELPLPATVREAVVRRVDRLGAPVRRLLEAASLAGDRFTLDEVVSATALGHADGFEALYRAVDAELVRTGDEGHVFAHPLVRRSLADALGPQRGALVHLRLAAALEAANGAPGRIAEHLEAAGQARRAAPWRLKAADAARAVYARPEALEHFRRALEDGLDDERTVEVRRRQVLLLQAENRFVEGAAVTEAWLDLARERGRPDWEAEALAWQGAQLHLQGRVPEALAVGETALRASEAPGMPPAVKVLAARLYGTYLRQIGRPAEAEGHLRAALDLAERPSGNAAFALDGLTYVALARGALDEATARNAEALAEFEAAGDPRGHAIALMTAARLRMLAEDLDGCLGFLRLTLAAARRMFDPDLTKRTLTNLVLTLLDAGRRDEAGERLAELAALPGADDANHGGWMRHVGALLARDRGELSRAADGLADAVRHADDLGEHPSRLGRRLDLAALLAWVGDGAGARALLAEARELVEARAARAPLRLVAEEARLDLAAGDAGAALARLDAAGPPQGADTPNDRATAELVRAEAALALGDPEAALAAAARVGGGAGGRAQALALRLRTLRALGRDAAADAEDAFVRLASGHVPAPEALDLGAAALAVLPPDAPAARERRGGHERRAEALLAPLPLAWRAALLARLDGSPPPG